jgi:hypothetical protein
MSFEKKPFVTISPYYWKNGKDWNRGARSNYGETLYPLGTYTFTINQNLNSIQESYMTNLTGTITDSASVTFVKDPSSDAPQDAPTVVITTPEINPPFTHTGTITQVPASSQTGIVTTVPATTPLPVRTTYTPLPVWIVIGGMIIAALVVKGKNR